MSGQKGLHTNNKLTLLIRRISISLSLICVHICASCAYMLVEFRVDFVVAYAVDCFVEFYVGGMVGYYVKYYVKHQTNGFYALLKCFTWNI